MNIKKLLLSIFVAFIISNILTSLWYMLSDEANFVSFRRAEMNYAGLMLNHLIYATIFVILFSSYIKESSTIIRGFIFGCLMGALMFIPSGIVVRSIWTVDFNTIFLFNALAHILIGGIMGILLTFIYNFKSKRT